MPIIKQNDIIDVIYDTICGYEPEEAYKILELYQAKGLIPVEWIEKWFSQFYGEQGLEWNRCKRFMLEDWEKEIEQKDNDRLILKAWKKTTLTKEELEKAFKDNEFNEYIQMLINKEFEKRLKQKVQGYESRDTESIK